MTTKQNLLGEINGKGFTFIHSDDRGTMSRMFTGFKREGNNLIVRFAGMSDSARTDVEFVVELSYLSISKLMLIEYGEVVGFEDLDIEELTLEMIENLVETAFVYTDVKILSSIQ